MTSKQMIEWRDRILNTPKHLIEFEEECAMRSIGHKIEMAQAEEARVARVLRKSALDMSIFNALMATAEYAKGVETRKSLLHAVGELYLQASA